MVICLIVSQLPSLSSLHLCRAIGISLLAALLASCASPDRLRATGPRDPLLALLVERDLIGGTQAPPAQPARAKASELVITALNFLDRRYQNGGSSSDDGFDCSGFTRYVFATGAGLTLPRTADEQASAAGLVPVERERLQPGDLVFFNTLNRTFSHVGLYVGDGKFVHAPRSGASVRVEDMRLAYWARRFTGARRAELGEVAAATP